MVLELGWVPELLGRNDLQILLSVTLKKKKKMRGQHPLFKHVHFELNLLLHSDLEEQIMCKRVREGTISINGGKGYRLLEEWLHMLKRTGELYMKRGVPYVHCGNYEPVALG